ncbi:hypothetical protein Tco_0003378 [Tanacetum coccineum]
MTMDKVIFQTNNVVGNFNYPPNVPAYKPIMKFLRSCHLYNAFTNCPSVVYQNFLREFWSTVVAFDPFPSTDELEKRPLKEFLIKFSARTTPPDPSKVTDIELTTHMIAVNNRRDSVFPPPLAAKPKKGKSQTVTSTLPKSQVPEASGALSKKSKRPKSKKPPIETKVTPPKPMEGSEQSHSVSSGTIPDPQDLKRDIQLDSRGLPSTLDEGTRKSKPLLESTAKTMPRPEGSLRDKDSRENIPPADMEPIHTPIADPSGTGAKYQTFADIKAFLLSDDELEKESDEEEVLAAGDDIDEDPQDDVEVRSPSPNQTQPEPSHVQESASDSVLFTRITEKQWEQHKEAAVSYADLKASIEEYYEENIAHRDQTDQLVAAFSTMQDLQAYALKQEEASDAWTKSSTNMAWNLGSRMTAVEISQTALKRSVTPTLALTHIPANVEGENATNTATEEPPSHTEGETGDTTMEIPISSIQPSYDQPITPIISHPESSQATPRIDKGKGIATESKENP